MLSTTNNPMAFTPKSGSSSLSFEWLFNEQAFVLTLQNTRKEPVDAEFCKILELASYWSNWYSSNTSANTPFCMLLDLSARDCTYNAYLRDRHEELITLYPNLVVRIAVVSNRNMGLIVQFARLVLLHAEQRRHNFKGRLFFSRSEAEEWLKQQLTIY